jgi:hypothetical protein
MLQEMKEKRLAKNVIRRALKSHSTVKSTNPGLSGTGLYKETLLHTQLVDPSAVDRMLDEAEDSVDEWTAPGRTGLGFREVVHFLVMAKMNEAGHKWALVSVGDIVNSMIPEDL